MKDDGNALARPAPLRVKSHRQDVAQHHRGEVERAEDKQVNGCAPPRLREEACAARKIQADFAVQNNDDRLAQEKPRI